MEYAEGLEPRNNVFESRLVIISFYLRATCLVTEHERERVNGPIHCPIDAVESNLTQLIEGHLAQLVLGREEAESLGGQFVPNIHLGGLLEGVLLPLHVLERIFDQVDRSRSLF